MRRRRNAISATGRNSWGYDKMNKAACPDPGGLLLYICIKMHKHCVREKNTPIQHNIQGTVRKGRTSLSIFSGKDFGQIVKNGGIFGKTEEERVGDPGEPGMLPADRMGFRDFDP